MSQITHLYIKTHNVTGLKYFGKTTSKDPYTYSGSGKYWLRHLHKYEFNFSTKIVASFTKEQKEEMIEFALFFSEFYNIVESKEWANLKPENGLDGGWPDSKGENNPFYGKSHTKETKNKVRQTRIDRGLNKPEKNGMYNRTHSQEARNKLKEYRTGLSMDHKTKDKISNTTKGVPKTKSKCIYCEKLCAPNLLNRWHNDNCKFKTVI
jgi:hypothetical protein